MRTGAAALALFAGLFNAAQAQDEADPLGELIATVQDPLYAPPPPAAPDIFGSFALLSRSQAADSQARRLEDIAWPPREGPWNALLGRLGGLSRLEQLIAVNSWVNRNLAVADDRDVYGKADYWASIEEAFARRRRGDCEDFAIAKMQLLEAAGISRRDLYLAVLKDEVRGVDHAVLAVRDGDRFWILDSLVNELRRSEHALGYRPVMSFSAGHAWVHGFRSSASPVTPTASAP